MKAWTKGDRVVQPTYGPGTLVEVNEHHTVIDFDEGGRKSFATRLVVLQATNEPAPPSAARKRAVKKKKAESREGEKCRSQDQGSGRRTFDVLDSDLVLDPRLDRPSSPGSNAPPA